MGWGSGRDDDRRRWRRGRYCRLARPPPTLGLQRLIPADPEVVLQHAWIGHDQDHRIGKELLRRLLDVAKREGVDEVFGEISSENMTMQKICRSMGFLIRRDYEDTTVTARYTIR